MNDMQNQFLSLWQECYNASYYALRMKKTAGFLHERKVLESEIHRQVWDERFGNAMVAHPASVFLDDLQENSLETAIHVRSRVRSFRPRIGVNLTHLYIALAAAVLLLALLLFLPRLLVLAKIKWLVRGVLGALLALDAAFAAALLMQSLRAPQALKAAFEQEKNAILELLEAVR